MNLKHTTSWLDKGASLTPNAHHIICEKATEPPYTGNYNAVKTSGTYLCRRCGLALFRGDSQFLSGCGWPSFDIEIPMAVRTLPDPDGQRLEIRCARCDGHLGHVFEGEQLTIKNRRYCVNGAAIDYVSNSDVLDTAEAIVAGGCFWGVDYYLRQISGVLAVEVGYTGGTTSSPHYEQVCSGKTGHYEAVRVLYDVAKTDYQTILMRFFEIHDPTQRTGQGPDLGSQYRSAVFCYNQQQKDIALHLIQQLNANGHNVVTQLLPVETFWPAEEGHQHYYAKHNKMPYCHQPVLRF